MIILRSITKYNKKIKWVFIKSAAVICGFMIVFFPWFEQLSSTDEGYYSVVFNGERLGVVSSPDTANEAYLRARLLVENENEASVFIDYDLNIYEEDKLYGKKLSEEELADKLYDRLKTSSVEVKNKAYVVDIEGFTVTLSSKEEVVQLLNAAKSKYDVEDKFTSVLTDSTDSRFSYITYEFVSAATANRDQLVVMASDGSQPETDEASKPLPAEDGIVNINFSENVEIVETYVPEAQIISLDEAIELVTKEKEENKIYEVVSGDTLSGIARMYELSLDELLAMNPDYSEDKNIYVGDRINVTVPEPELSVIVQEHKTYKEAYNLPVEYVDNDSQYNTYSKVLNEGSEGYREVMANVTYVNGVESKREILSETVITQAEAKVIERGTITPPTFIKPISGGYLSSGFGARWGTVHRGVDWACSTGTSIMASCGGTVIQAGWYGGYGYCVTIQHDNGIQTRYGHMSKVLVSSGEYVQQGEVIGRSGSTGNSTGPHVHFEIIVNGTKVNPLTYLD